MYAMSTHFMQRPLESKVALVTGASRGIGQAIAAELAKLGASVAINFSKDASGASETASLVQAQGSKAAVVQADVSESAAASALVEE
ncbi:MAG: hypothetical protein C4317_01475, partial [Acidimicrobiia bacterium]